MQRVCHGFAIAAPQRTAARQRRVRARIFRNINQALNRKGNRMNINLSLAPVVSLIAGILILLMPRLLNFIVAIYLIVIGLIGLFGTGNLHLR